MVILPANVDGLTTKLLVVAPPCWVDETSANEVVSWLGSVSIKPLNGMVLGPLLIKTMEKLAVPPSGMVGFEIALAALISTTDKTFRQAATVMGESVAVTVPLTLAVLVPVMLVFKKSAGPVVGEVHAVLGALPIRFCICTVIWQLTAPGLGELAIPTPVATKLAVDVVLNAPPTHPVLVVTGELATNCRPLTPVPGALSVKLMLVAVTRLVDVGDTSAGLVSVKVSVMVPPSATDGCAKALVSVGLSLSTMLSCAVLLARLHSVLWLPLLTASPVSGRASPPPVVSVVSVPVVAAGLPRGVPQNFQCLYHTVIGKGKGNVDQAQRSPVGIVRVIVTSGQV